MIWDNGAEPYDAHELKLKLYNMMLEEWKLTFLASIMNLMDPNYAS